MGTATAGRHRRRWPGALVGALLCAYVWGSATRVWQWRSSEALYAADAAAWPRSVKTRHQLGTVYHAQSQYSEALAHYNASLTILDDNALTDHCIAQLYIETGRYADALERFEKIFRGHLVGFSQFNLWMLYVDYGFALMMLRRFEEAVPLLQQGLNLNEDVPHGLNALGFCLTQLGHFPEGREAFERGLRYDPTNPWLTNNLGVAHALAGELKDGSDLIVSALAAEPSVPAFAHNARVLQTLLESGRWPDEPLALELFFNRGG